MSISKKSGLWTKPYILLSVTNFFAWLSYNMVTPVLTGYMGTLGASVSICGITGGLFAFTSLLSRPVSGVLADMKNRKHLMAGFTILMTVSLLIYSVIPSVPVILLFRGLHGVAFGISSTASLVLVSESAPEERMGEAISYYGLMSVASMAIGPSLGIWLSAQAGYQVCMLAGTVMLAIAQCGVRAVSIYMPGGNRFKKGFHKSKIRERFLSAAHCRKKSYRTIRNQCFFYYDEWSGEHFSGCVCCGAGNWKCTDALYSKCDCSLGDTNCAGEKIKQWNIGNEFISSIYLRSGHSFDNQ